MNHTIITQQSDQGISVKSGFPNAATDTSLQGLNLNQLLISHSASTFMMRVSGDDWQALGVWHGDIALIDRALSPRGNDIVVWLHEDAFALSNLPDVPKSAVVWGVVTTIIHQYHTYQKPGQKP